jgi:hypothetical protein
VIEFVTTSRSLKIRFPKPDHLNHQEVRREVSQGNRWDRFPAKNNNMHVLNKKQIVVLTVSGEKKATIKHFK